MSKKIDATRPLYAVVGATDLAVEYARKQSADVQARLSKIELEPKALGDQARTVLVTRIDELGKDAKEARDTVEARAKEARTQVETYVNDAVAEVTETYGDLAARGRKLVNRIRRQQATQDAKAAAETTVAKVKTTRTQTTKSAKSSASTAKRATKSATKSSSTAAKKTGETAKRNVKATTTSAKKTAEATVKAAGDAAEKVGD